MNYSKKYSRLERDLSEGRLSSFLSLADGNKITALRYYRHNLLLSQAIWESLSIFEVILRNRIVKSWNWWFKNKKFIQNDEVWPFHHDIIFKRIKANRSIQLDVKYVKKLSKSINLAKERSEITALENNRIINNDDVVSKIMFGTWHDCLSSNADFINITQITKISPFFPFANLSTNKISGDISKIADEVNQIKQFRNRLAHLDFIRLPQAVSKYNQIIQFIEYINPDAKIFINHDYFYFLSKINSSNIKNVKRQFPYHS